METRESPFIYTDSGKGQPPQMRHPPGAQELPSRIGLLLLCVTSSASPNFCLAPDSKPGQQGTLPAVPVPNVPVPAKLPKSAAPWG